MRAARIALGLLPLLLLAATPSPATKGTNEQARESGYAQDPESNYEQQDTGNNPTGTAKPASNPHKYSKHKESVVRVVRGVRTPPLCRIGP